MHDAKIRICIAGASGRMGRELIQAILLQKKDVTLGAALESKDSSFLGRDVGELINIGKIGIIVQSSLGKVKDAFDIFIDFTCPKGTLDHLAFCLQNNKAMVIGTTGFNEIEKQKIREVSNKIAIVLSSNFSIGVNVILKLLEKTAKVIGNYTDIEIIETHHRYKADIPSGTALSMGETIANTLNKDLKKCAIFPHKRKNTDRRIPGMIGFTAIRAGDVMGEHTVMFANSGERIEITHKASSRMIFANGAIKSAIWLKERKSGLFSMRDVLGLDDL